MSEENGEVSLSILDVQAIPRPGNIYDVTIKTSRGDVFGILHPAVGGSGAVIWVGGASGGMNGPAGGLYINLSQGLVAKGIASLRLRYRFPNILEECILDTLAAVSVLHGLGSRKIGLVGHSFGGAVVITAAALSSQVDTVVALSSQSVGTHLVGQISPRPILLAHAMRDMQVSSACSQDIFDRAGEPKRLELFPNGGHDLAACQQEVHKLVGEWLVEHIGSGGLTEQTKDVTNASSSYKVFPTRAGSGSNTAARNVTILEEDITVLKADAIVNPTTEDLWLSGAVGEAIRRRGAFEIEDQLANYAPATIGSVVVTGAGSLRCRYVIHAVVAGGLGSSDAPTVEIVAEATKNALLKANDLKLRSVAFPALGTGGGGLPIEKAAEVMVGAIVNNLRGTTSLDEVYLVVNGTGAFRAFAAQLQYILESQKGNLN